MACPNIDGFLVGGASLLPEFVDIMKVTILIIADGIAPHDSSRSVL